MGTNSPVFINKPKMRLTYKKTIFWENISPEFLKNQGHKEFKGYIE